jgi:hypothetical protein
MPQTDNPSSDWPFQTWFRLAVLQMNIAPQDFWNMALRDWFWLCRAGQSNALTRESFDSLFEQFPDDQTPSDKEDVV